jgi:hypothetical protein
VVGIGKHRCLVAVLAALATAAFAAAAHAQNARQEDPIPTSPETDFTAIDSLFRPPPPPRLTLFPQMREQMQDAPAFVRDSALSVHPRSFYLDQVKSSPAKSTATEAWAGGGWINAETGRLFDVLSFGTVVYGTFPIYAPLAYGNTGLLQPDQAGFAVPGQLYARADLFDNTTRLVAGRYLYNTPYLGPQDNRMIPNTFYGYSLVNTLGDPGNGPSLRWGGGYIATIKPRDSATFLSMSRQAGANVDNGVGVAGGRLTWGKGAIGLVEYFCQDTLNIAYGEAEYGIALTKEIYAELAVQYADQRTVGANLTNGGAYYQTNTFGSRFEVGYRTGILTLGLSTVNPNFAMVNPWSSNPIYTDAQVQSFQRAGETTLMAGLSYVFTPLGLPGIGASVFYYNGSSNSAAGGPVAENEWDFDLEWRPNFRPLSGLWLRARYATVAIDQNSVHTDIQDVRMILNYSLKIY